MTTGGWRAPAPSHIRHPGLVPGSTAPPGDASSGPSPSPPQGRFTPGSRARSGCASSRAASVPRHRAAPAQPHRGSRNKSGMTKEGWRAPAPSHTRHPGLVPGSTAPPGDTTSGPSPSPTARSFHAGLSRSIKLRFQSRRQRPAPPHPSRPAAPWIPEQVRDDDKRVASGRPKPYPSPRPCAGVHQATR